MTCLCAKCARLTKPKKDLYPKTALHARAKETLYNVHCDVLGPVSAVSMDGHKTVTGFQGSYSRRGKDYFMKSRDEVAAKFEQYCADIGKSRVLVIDCAKEFVGGDMKPFCRNEGIR